jgi:hypothetical protein
MKMLTVILMLAVAANTLCAQEAHYAFAAHPYVTRRDMAASRFWTKSTLALTVLDGAAKAADSYATRKNIDGGGVENNPLARPFVRNTAVQVVATGALFGAEIASAYWLHKRHHDRIARAMLLEGAAMNGLGAATSIKHRVADW